MPDGLRRLFSTDDRDIAAVRVPRSRPSSTVVDGIGRTDAPRGVAPDIEGLTAVLGQADDGVLAALLGDLQVGAGNRSVAGLVDRAGSGVGGAISPAGLAVQRQDDEEEYADGGVATEAAEDASADAGAAYAAEAATDAPAVDAAAEATADAGSTAASPSQDASAAAGADWEDAGPVAESDAGADWQDAGPAGGEWQDAGSGGSAADASAPTGFNPLDLVADLTGSGGSGGGPTEQTDEDPNLGAEGHPDNGPVPPYQPAGVAGLPENYIYQAVSANAMAGVCAVTWLPTFHPYEGGRDVATRDPNYDPPESRPVPPPIVGYGPMTPASPGQPAMCLPWPIVDQDGNEWRSGALPVVDITPQMPNSNPGEILTPPVGPVID